MNRRELLEHGEFVRAVVRRLVADEATADDLVQETWVRVLRSPPRHDRSIRAWLARVARNVALNWLRREKRHADRVHGAELPATPPSPDELVDRMHERRRVIDAVLKLDEPWRATVLLRFFEGLTPLEIARLHKIPPGTVRSRLHRGLEKVKRRLERQRGGLASLAPLLALPRGVLTGAIVMKTKSTITAAAVLLLIAATFTVVALSGAFPDDGPDSGDEARRSLNERTAAEGSPASKTGGETGEDIAVRMLPKKVGEAAEGEEEAAEEARDGNGDAAIGKGKGEVYGTVRETGSTRRLAGVVVYLVPGADGYGKTKGRTLRTRTDDHGRFSFRGVPRGRFVVVPISRGHYIASSLRIDQRRTTEGIRHFGPPPDVAVLMPRAGARVRRDVRLARGLGVHGRVVDPAGKPVAGATVHLAVGRHNHFSKYWGIVWPVPVDAELAVSDEYGRFSATGIAFRGKVRLFARKASFAPVPSDYVLLRPDFPEPEVELRLRAAASLSGRVVDDLGKPLAGTAVTCRWIDRVHGRFAGIKHASDTLEMRTDTEGCFAFQGVPAAHEPLRLEAYLAGFPRRRMSVKPLAAGEDRSIEIVFARGAALTGVLVGVDGAPRAGVPILAFSERARLGVTTDAAGRFSLFGLSEGEVTLRARPNYESLVELGAFKAPAENLVLTLREYRLRGRVVGPESLALASCRVAVDKAVIRNAGMLLLTGDPFVAIDGVFDIPVTGPPPYEVTVTGARGANAQLLNLLPRTVTVHEAADLLIRLEEPGASLEGRTIDAAGAPVQGVELRVGALRIRSTADGRFSFGGLSADTVTLMIKAPEGYFARKSMRVAPGGPVIDVLLQRALAIAGVVRTSAGETISEGVASATWPGGRQTARLRGDGTFQIEGVPEGVTATVSVTTWGAVLGPKLPPGRVESIAAGATGVEVVLPAPVYIEGLVVDARGAPVVRVAVTSTRDGKQTGAGDTDREGRFRFAVAHVGEHALSVFRGRRIAGPIPADAPGRNVRLVVADQRTVRGRITGTDGDVSGFIVMAWAAFDPGRMVPARVRKDGSFQITVRFEGAVTVVARNAADGRFARERVEDLSRELTLKPKPGESIRGRVEGPEGPKLVTALGDDWRSGARVDGDGSFVMRGLPKGKYRLVVSGYGKRAEQPDVATGAEDVVLKMK